MSRKASAEELEIELAAVKEEKKLYELEKEIRDTRRGMRRWKSPTKTELITALLFINFGIVEVYSMWVMVYMYDISALYVLITTILAEPITLAVYAIKAYHGKKQEEAVKLEREKMAADRSSPAEDGMDETADPEAVKESNESKEVAEE